jgi:hypothetical protein
LFLLIRLLTAFLAAGFELESLLSARLLPRSESIRSVVCEGFMLAMVGFDSLIEGEARSPKSEPVCMVGFKSLSEGLTALTEGVDTEGVEGVDGV